LPDNTELDIVEVLFLDNHLLVVNKPAGQPVQEDSSGDLDLLTEAKAFIGREFNKPGKVFIGLVHRLDRPVSGVVVFARTSKAAARLSDQFRRRIVRKEYLALVEGWVTEPRSVTSFLQKRGVKVRQVKESAPGAKEATLRYEPLAVFGRRSLIKVVPLTGRPHQIRVQLSHDGFPIVGDVKYGAKLSLDGRNIALHCHRMTLAHPVLKEERTWSTPPPVSWPADVRSGLSSF